MFRKLAPGILALTCATVVHASGTTHMVSADGSMEYTSIQDAIDAAVNGDVIEVYPGTYSEKLDTKGKAIEVTGQPDPETGDLPVIRGTGEYGPIMTFNTGEEWTTKVSWFIFEHGDAESGGAVYIEKASPELSDCFFERNQALRSGGAITAVLSSARLVRCIFIENTSEWLGGAVCLYKSPVQMFACSFSDSWSDSFGAAIYIYQDGGKKMWPVLISCLFGNNQAASSNSQIQGHWVDLAWNYFFWSDVDSDGDGIPDEMEPQMSDQDGNGDIDATDLFGTLYASGELGVYNPGDRDGDGDVDGDDLTLMLLALDD